MKEENKELRSLTDYVGLGVGIVVWLSYLAALFITHSITIASLGIFGGIVSLFALILGAYGIINFFFLTKNK